MTGELGVRAKVATFGVSQTFVASVMRYHAKSENAFALSDFSGFGSKLDAPVDVAPPSAGFFTGGVLAAPRLTDRTQTASVAIADLIGFFDDRVLLSLGARHQKLENTGYDYNTGAAVSSYSKSRVTPVAGLVVRLGPRVSLYANHIEGLARGDTALDTYVDAAGVTRPVVNAGEATEPYQSKQEELVSCPANTWH